MCAPILAGIILTEANNQTTKNMPMRWKKSRMNNLKNVNIRNGFDSFGWEMCCSSSKVFSWHAHLVISSPPVAYTKHSHTHTHTTFQYQFQGTPCVDHHAFINLLLTAQSLAHTPGYHLINWNIVHIIFGSLNTKWNKWETRREKNCCSPRSQPKRNANTKFKQINNH